MKKDRLVAGGISGIVGSIFCDTVGVLFKSLGWSDRTFYENATILLTNQIYSDEGIFGLILSLITHFAVCSIFGVLFAYIILFTTSNYLYIKGLGYGLVLWVLLHGFGTIFNLPLFTNMPLDIAYATLSFALVYGFTTAFTLKILEEKTQLL